MFSFEPEENLPCLSLLLNKVCQQNNCKNEADKEVVKLMKPPTNIRVKRVVLVCVGSVFAMHLKRILFNYKLDVMKCTNKFLARPKIIIFFIMETL